MTGLYQHQAGIGLSFFQQSPTGITGTGTNIQQIGIQVTDSGIGERINRTFLFKVYNTATHSIYRDKRIRRFIKAKRLAEDGSVHGTLVVADEQTGGRGRRGRAWDSKKGVSIYMSLVLKPEIDPNNASMLTLITAMAVAGGIEKTTGLECKIKWPNDIVVHGKKVCGILTEMSTQMDYINYIVIGIGINVQNESFPEEIGEVATSLWIESGKKQKRAAIIEAVWEEFEKYYDIYLKTEDMQGLVGEYDQKLANMNKQVRVLDPKDPYEGTARGITPKGELIVDTWEARKLVSSGEVSVRGLYGYV